VSYDVLLEFARGPSVTELEKVMAGQFGDLVRPEGLRNGKPLCWKCKPSRGGVARDGFFTIETKSRSLLGRPTKLSWNLVYGGSLEEAQLFSNSIHVVAGAFSGTIVDLQVGGPVPLKGSVTAILAKWREANTHTLIGYAQNGFVVRPEGCRIVVDDGREVMVEARRASNPVESLLSVASAFYAAKDWLNAARACVQTLEHVPNAVPVMVMLGGCLVLGDRDLDEAQRLFERALELEPENEKAREGLALVAVRREKKPE
jgi:tetratricopeptide (TPR) repeat protein